MINFGNNFFSIKKYTSWYRSIPVDYYLVCIFAIISYFIGYLLYPGTPGNYAADFMGWFSWCDQGWYLKAAEAISELKLSSGNYIYPLGYPLLAVPFLNLLPRHAFLLPNLFFSVGIVLAFYGSCRSIVTKIESFVLATFLIIFSACTGINAVKGGLIWSNTLIVPWNVIPVFFAAYLAIWLLIFKKANTFRLWIVSIAIAIAFFARSSDVLFLGLIYIASLIDLDTIKKKIQGILILIIPCMIIFFAIISTKWVVFHNFLSPYDINISRNQGFGFSELFFKFYLVFFDGSPVFGFRDPVLFQQMPWLLLIIPGSILLIKFTKRKFWFLLISIFVCFIIYISYNAQVPSNTYNYYGFRYFIWAFPWFGLCAYLTLTRCISALGKTITFIGILIAFLFLLAIGWKEKKTAVVFPDVVNDVGVIIQKYDSKNRIFSGEINYTSPLLSDCLKITFSKLPSVNMAIAGDWEKFNLIIDDKKQLLIRDYNLFQTGKSAYVLFRNPINQTGKIKNVVFQFSKTDSCEIKNISILKKEYQPFVAFNKLLNSFSFKSSKTVATEDQDYFFGTDIVMGSGGNSEPYKLFGWSGDEQGFNWSEGNSSFLGFRTSPVSRNITMYLGASGLPTQKPQIARIKVNEKFLTTITLTPERKMHTITIPPEYLKADGIVLIQFDFPFAISPFKIGMNQDKRILSMALYTFRLE